MVEVYKKFFLLIFTILLGSCSTFQKERKTFASGVGVLGAKPWEKRVNIFGMQDNIKLRKYELLHREAEEACGSKNFKVLNEKIITKSFRNGTIDLDFEIFCTQIYENTMLAKKKKEENKNLKRVNNTCKKFGFKIDTPELSKCVFEIYKLEMSQTKNSINSSSNEIKNESALNAILEEQKKQNELERKLLLLQNSLNSLNQIKPKLNCKYNPAFRNITCN